MQTPINRVLWIVAGLLLVTAILWYFRVLISYIVIAAVIGFIGDPVVDRLRRIRIRRWQLPRALCAGLVLFGFVLLFGGLFWLFAPLIAEEAAFLSSMNIYSFSAEMEERFVGFSAWLDSLGMGFNSSEVYGYLGSKARELVSFEDLSGVANNLFGFISSFIAGLFSVLFMSFFFLKDGSLFYRLVFTITPDRYMEQVKNILSHSHRMLSRYFGGLFLQVLIMFGMVTLGLMALGVKNAILIGVFAGLANVIPYVGPLVAIGFGLLVGITSGLAADPEMHILSAAIRIVAVFGVAQFIDNWIIQPFVVGPTVNTHPLELFIVLLAAATIGGVMAMALALPVYTILRIVAREFFQQFKLVESLTRDLDES